MGNINTHHLTLTSVVFEFSLSCLEYLGFSDLTLTSVVFEYTRG